MANIITAPADVAVSGFKVYLGGAIDMGQAEDWQTTLAHLLQDEKDLVLINPRRPDFSPEHFDEQVLWELDAMEKADCVLMWFPAASKAPIALLESGLYMRSGKLLIGAEPDYYRRRNLELTTQHHGVRLWSDLGEIAEAIKRLYHNRA